MHRRVSSYGSVRGGGDARGPRRAREERLIDRAATDPGDSTIACSKCAARQRIPALPRGAHARCRRCDLPLERGSARMLDAALANAVASLLLLAAALALPLLRTGLLGVEREAWLFSSASAYWQSDEQLLALLMALFVVVFPVARAMLLTAVLASLRLGLRPRWLGPAFRHARELRPWSMPEIFLLAAFVSWLRLRTIVDLEIAAGGWALIAFVLLAAVQSRLLDARRVWRAIAADVAPAGMGPTMACDACCRLVPHDEAGRPCPRCGRLVRPRRRAALSRATACVVAAALLYVPCYVMPIAVELRLGQATGYSILTTLENLWEEGLWSLAVILVTASVLIPLLKLVGMSWLLLRVYRPARRGLARRTRMHSRIHEIGRWSYVDPFAIAVALPLLAYPGVAELRPGEAVLPFALVVSLTMLASRWFDSRLLWDAAGEAP